MKCEVCLKLLEEYIDGELVEHEAAPVSAHLMTCAGCANEFDTLSTEQEIYTRYDRALEIAPSMWNAIAERTTAAALLEGRTADTSARFCLRDWFVAPSFGWSFAGAMAVLIAALVIGLVYLRAYRQPTKQETIASEKKINDAGSEKQQAPDGVKTPAANPGSNNLIAVEKRPPVKVPLKVASAVASQPSKKPEPASIPDVLVSDEAYTAAEEQDIQRHLEQAENLLRSVRNIQVAEDETEVDVSYEKALSRRLLNENVILRRDAEMSGKFPTKTLLSDLEPFLIDIANLHDRSTPDELRAFKDRVRKTEIVATLQSY